MVSIAEETRRSMILKQMSWEGGDRWVPEKTVIRSCLNEVLDVLEPADVLLNDRRTRSELEQMFKDFNESELTFCSLYSAYSGTKYARVWLIPRSCKNLSNSSWSEMSSVSNWRVCSDDEHLGQHR